MEDEYDEWYEYDDESDDVESDDDESDDDESDDINITSFWLREDIMTE